MGLALICTDHSQHPEARRRESFLSSQTKLRREVKQERKQGTEDNSTLIAFSSAYPYPFFTKASDALTVLNAIERGKKILLCLISTAAAAFQPTLSPYL